MQEEKRALPCGSLSVDEERTGWPPFDLLEWPWTQGEPLVLAVIYKPEANAVCTLTFFKKTKTKKISLYQWESCISLEKYKKERSRKLSQSTGWVLRVTWVLALWSAPIAFHAKTH